MTVISHSRREFARFMNDDLQHLASRTFHKIIQFEANECGTLTKKNSSGNSPKRKLSRLLLRPRQTLKLRNVSVPFHHVVKPRGINQICQEKNRWLSPLLWWVDTYSQALFIYKHSRSCLQVYMCNAEDMLVLSITVLLHSPSLGGSVYGSLEQRGRTAWFSLL